MIVTHHIDELGPPPKEGSVVSIGVFDGVHLGHEAILAANVARSRELGARPTVVTFSSHPKSVLLGRAPRTLTSLEHRLGLFERAGIEHTVALQFDEKLREKHFLTRDSRMKERKKPGLHGARRGTQFSKR